jgi:hypothetical protein
MLGVPLLAAVSGGALPACSQGAGDGAADQTLDGRCVSGTEAGFFQLHSEGGDGWGATLFMGDLGDRSVPSLYPFRPTMTVGGCSLMTMEVPVCTPACTGDLFCFAGGVCSSGVVKGRSAGTITLSGLARPYATHPIIDTHYESQPGDLPYPPAAPGAAIELRTSGGDVAPFVLGGEGMDPLRLVGTVPLAVTRDQPFTLDWVPPTQPGQARIIVDLDVGQNDIDRGSESLSYLSCDLPDTGAVTIPATLVDALVDAGVGTNPMIFVSRRTEDSTQIAAGCVSFRVESATAAAVTVNR